MTAPTSFINILVAEDNDVSRELILSVLRTYGMNALPATDGGEAIAILNSQPVDMAFVDINMAPQGGFDFIRHLVVRGKKIPVVIITGDSSSDILMEAHALGVAQVLSKPVDPARLIALVHRFLRQKGINPTPLAVGRHEMKYTAEQLMQRAVELAARNVRTREGGPFGAVVADTEGRVLGEGTNGISSRVDPVAHAEIMAIRQAAEKLGRADLADCVLYCTSEPTMMGKALIISVGIKQVYYGLSHEEIRCLRAGEDKVRAALHQPAEAANYEQLGHDAALAMYREWDSIAQNLKLHD